MTIRQLFYIWREGGARESEASRMNSIHQRLNSPCHVDSPQTDDRWCGGLVASGARGPPPPQPYPCALILHGFDSDHGGGLSLLIGLSVGSTELRAVAIVS
jgi:hypothetical protein